MNETETRHGSAAAAVPIYHGLVGPIGVDQTMQCGTSLRLVQGQVCTPASLPPLSQGDKVLTVLS